MWGTPLELEIDGVKTSIIYLDTEGFESVGKSNVYDDRYPFISFFFSRKFRHLFDEALNI